MKKIKRLVSFGGNEESQQGAAGKENTKTKIPRQVVIPPTPIDDMERAPIPKVQFQDDFESSSRQRKSLDQDQQDDHLLLSSLSVPRRPCNLQRTKSRSVECVKGPQQQQNLRRSIHKAQAEDNNSDHRQGSEMSLDGGGGVPPHFRKSRSQSYYAFRPRPALASETNSTGNLRKSFKGPSVIGSRSDSISGVPGAGYHGSASFKLGRCGSTPPTARGSIASIKAPGIESINSR